MNLNYGQDINQVRMAKNQILQRQESFLEKSKKVFSKVFKKGNADKNAKGGGFREIIAKLSRGLMLPIAILPIAGILLGVGAAIETNTTGVGKVIGTFIKLPGDVIFGNLPVLFCIAIAIAFTKDAGVAALAAFVGWIVFNGTQNALITFNTDLENSTYGSLELKIPTDKGLSILWYTPQVLKGLDESLFYYGLPLSISGTNVGIKSLSTSVFGAMIVGFIVAYLYNKYKNIQLPNIIGFFNGVRFVPIVVFASMIPLAVLFLMVWPLIGLGLNYFGHYLGNTPYGVNSLVFGFVERSLVPFGLHHAFYSPLWFSTAGGSIDVNANAQIVFENNLYNVVATGFTPGEGEKVSLINQGVTTITNNSSTVNVHTWRSLALAFNPNAKFNDNVIGGDITAWNAINANWAGKDVILYRALSVDGGFQGMTLSNLTKADIVVHKIQFGDFGNSIYPTQALTGYYFANATAVSNAGYTAGVSGLSPGQYSQGKYSFMIFGLTAAAFAMVMAAPKENRKFAASVILSAGGTSFLTGITEPIEFTFLFLAPALFWGFHASMCALSFWFANLAQMHVGQTFSGGFIDLLVYGVIPVQSGTQFWWAILIGIAYMPIYYFVFYFWIIKKNLQTPGRGENVRLFTKQDYLKRKEDDSNINDSVTKLSAQHIHAYKIILAYGGISNIKNVDACASKLRIQVANKTIVNNDKLRRELGAFGVISPSADSVYAVYGSLAEVYKSKIIDLLKNKAMLAEAAKIVK